MAFEGRLLNDTDKNCSNGGLKLLTIVWGLEKTDLFYGNKIFHRPQVLVQLFLQNMQLNI